MSTDKADEIPEDGIDYQKLGEDVGEALRQHGGDYLPFYCWNCGAKITGGPHPCPSCGAVSVGKTRYLFPHAPHQPGPASALHPSVLRYRAKSVAVTLVFCLLFSAGLSVYMFASGELDADSGGAAIMLGILGILWAFWIIWLIWEYGGSGRKMRQARDYNRTPGNVRIVCGLCSHYTDRRANYCSKCGCILAK